MTTERRNKISREKRGRDKESKEQQNEKWISCECIAMRPYVPFLAHFRTHFYARTNDKMCKDQDNERVKYISVKVKKKKQIYSLVLYA